RGGAAHHLIGMLVGAGDADGDLMVVLQQERNLLAGIPKAADGDDEIVLGRVRIKQAGIAAVVDYGPVRGMTVTRQLFEHPLRGCDDRSGASDSGRDCPATPS